MPELNDKCYFCREPLGDKYYQDVPGISDESKVNLCLECHKDHFSETKECKHGTTTMSREGPSLFARTRADELRIQRNLQKLLKLVNDG